MANFMGVIDPMYAIDYKTLVNAQKSSSSIKGFTTVVKSMTNTPLIGFDEDDVMSGMNINSSVYKALYNENSFSINGLVNHNYSDALNKYNLPSQDMNIYRDEFNNSLLSLYNSSNNVIVNDVNFMDIVNEKYYSDEIKNNNIKIYIPENFDKDNPSLCITNLITNETKEIFINDIQIDKANKDELSVYLSYYTMQGDKFSNSLSNLLDIDGDEFSSKDLEVLTSFAKNIKRYNTAKENYNDMQKELDKVNEENEKIDALFDLIDAINKMYSKYNKSQRENNRNKKNKWTY